MFGFNDIELKQARFYQQAVSEGRIESEATLLLCQLEHRVGPLSADTRQRIAEAHADTLLVWGERLLDAKTLAELWESRGARPEGRARSPVLCPTCLSRPD